jgi:drug/metabolite transporter (DMT)-like permease
VPLAKRLRRTALTSGLSFAGLVVLAVDQQLETGHWDAYLLVQRKYHHDLQNPIAATRDSLRPLVHGSPFELAKAPAAQTAVVTLALLAVLVYAALRRRSRDQYDGLLLLWAVVTWAMPLSQAAVSIQRSQAALLPLAVLVRRLPRPLVIALVVAAVAVAVAMEKLFLQGKIV